MKWVNNIPMRTKMWITFILLLIIIFLFIGFITESQNNLEQKNQKILKDLDRNELLTFQAVSKLTDFDLELLKQLTNPGKTSYKFLENKLNNLKSEYDKLFLQVETKEKIEPRIYNFMKNIHNSFEEYFKQRMLYIKLLERGNKRELADLLSSKDIASILNSVRMLSTALSQELVTISNKNLQWANSERVKISVLFGIMIVLALLFFFSVQYSIIKPIYRLNDVADSIGKGDLAVEIKDKGRKDEIGVLSSKIDKMTKNLKSFVKSLKKAVTDLVDSTTELSASISEISASVSESSSSISETTASIEEVKRTSDTALLVAKESVNTVEKGEKISREVSESINTTREGFEIVKKQVSILSQNILHLAEGGKMVGEIIELVNDIADQTNLLAVNASIEATRAGEQGKSFVIVAQEMKSLANQSRQATEKIKNILSDTQNSVNSSVMAAEKAEKTIYEQTEKAENQILILKDISQVMKEMQDVIKQVELTMNEQNIGMNEITDAMKNIKIASQQNSEVAGKVKGATEKLKEMQRNFSNIIEQYVTIEE